MHRSFTEQFSHTTAQVMLDQNKNIRFHREAAFKLKFKFYVRALKTAYSYKKSEKLIKNKLKKYLYLLVNREPLLNRE